MLGTEQLRSYVYVCVSNAGSLQYDIPLLHELVAGEHVHLARLGTDRGQVELLHHDPEKRNFPPLCSLFGLKLKTSSQSFRRLLLADTGHVGGLLLQDLQPLLGAAGELRPGAGRAGGGAGDDASHHRSIKCSRLEITLN